MARKYWRYRRNNKSEDPLASLFAIAVLGIAAYLYTHRQEVVSWLFIIAGVLIIGAIAYSFFKKFKKAATLGWDDDKILYMLKGMSPAQFESEVAKMFEALGYKTEVVGGANDGGIDVVARKEGKKYFIQCKKFITREATPHDVRDFLGA